MTDFVKEISHLLSNSLSSNSPAHFVIPAHPTDAAHLAKNTRLTHKLFNSLIDYTRYIWLYIYLSDCKQE